MAAPTSRHLAVLDEASRLLAEANSLDEIKAIRSKAEAVRTYVKAAQLGLDLQNRAAEVKLRAERKAGQFLQAMNLRGGDRRSNGHHVRLKLEDFGISQQQSKRWQSVALVPETDFCRYLRSAKDQGREVTSAGLLRIARAVRAPHVDNSRARSRRSASPNTIEQNRSSPDELLDELANHCHLLSDVLRPVYEEGALELPRAEKRLVGRLIREMSELINQLNKIM